MKNKSTPAKKDFSENVLEISKRSPFLIETGVGKESVNQTFTRSSEKNFFKLLFALHQKEQSSLKVLIGD